MPNPTKAQETDKELRDEMNTRINLQEQLGRLEFFTAILLAVSEHRAQSLTVLEDFIANLKDASARG